MRFGGAGAQADMSALGRFHFDLEAGDEVIEDREGVEAAGSEEAMAQARAVIAEMRDADELLAPGAWTLVVRDAEGAILDRLRVE